MKKTNVLKIAILMMMIISIQAQSKSSMVSQIPNGNKNGCLTCHTSSQGGARNKFGQEISKSFLSGSNVNWNSLLAGIDSDGDGFSNGAELQDPNGSWKKGDAAPGTTSLVTNPGDASSKPAATDVLDAGSIPEDFGIAKFSISPNPFSINTVVSYDLRKPGDVRIAIYSIDGLLDYQFDFGNREAGSYSFEWDLRNNSGQKLTPGVYFIILWLDQEAVVNKFII